jgi:hypothetical protein
LIGIRHAIIGGDDQRNMLLCPNQIRTYGGEIDSCPKFLSQGKSIHGIKIIDEEGSEWYFPYQLKGCMSVLPIRKPTQQELETCPIVWLTSDQPWEPNAIDWEEQEKRYLNQTKSIRLNIPLDQVKQCMGITNDLTAEKTLELTTQMGTISTVYPLRQHMKARFSMYGIKRINDTVYTDTIFSSEAAIDGGEKCAQVFVIGKKNFVTTIPMKTENQAPEAFKDFIIDYGAPKRIHSDNAPVETGAEWVQIRRKFYIKGTQTEPYHPEQNHCE